MANNKIDLCNENHYMKLQSLALKLKCERNYYETRFDDQNIIIINYNMILLGLVQMLYRLFFFRY